MLTYTTLASGSSGNAALVSCGSTHVLVDASDDYIASEIGPAFGCPGLPDDKPGEPVLLAIEYRGDTVRWTPVEGGGGA